MSGWNPKSWFAVFWPTTAKARRVLDGYGAMAKNRELMADIALRGGLFSADYNPALTARDDAIAEGRRQLALEIYKLANLEPAALYGLLESPSKPEANRRP